MTSYQMNLSMEELKQRTHKDYLTTKKFLKKDAPEYLELAKGDKEALKTRVVSLSRDCQTALVANYLSRNDNFSYFHY